MPSDFTSKLVEQSSLENEKFLYRDGFELTDDHMTTGDSWQMLTEKATEETHSGPRWLLKEIFRGTKTLDYDLYGEGWEKLNR